MRRHHRILGVLLCLLLLLPGCGTKIEQVPVDEPEPVEPVEEAPAIRSYLSGWEIEPGRLKQRPMAVMLDNHPQARWQHNITLADLVYEIPVEGTYTRYMALFLTNEPDEIGSVRSARPYFVRLAEEYQAVYVHAGGSEEAKNLARNSTAVIDMDAIVASPAEFWRVDHKKAPHNLYTSSEAIRQFETNHGGTQAVEGVERFQFEDEPTARGDGASDVIIRYFADNETEYRFDEASHTYRRYKDGVLHIDEKDEKELAVANIIIQRVESRVIDQEGRLAVDVVGAGEGMLYTQGQKWPITWSKTSEDAPTTYRLENGEPLTLVPGQTWIQVIDQRTAVEDQVEVSKTDQGEDTP